MSQSKFYPGHLGVARMWLEYIGLRVVVAPLRLLPIDRASAVSGRLWRWIAPFTHRHRRVQEHLGYAFPELSAEERERIARGSWENLGRVFAEGQHLGQLVSDADRFELPAGLDRYRRIARNGCVFVSLHLGNWEVAALPALGKDIDIAGTYQPIQNPLVERYLKAMRAPLYGGGLHAKGPATARRLTILARSGGAVGFLADLRERRGVRVVFFDRPAYANPFPAALARRHGLPIVAGCMVRTGGVHFRLELKVVEVPQSDDRDRDAAEATQAIHEVFEHWIRITPEQWMWAHRKWALRAGDEPS
ncbi:lysophospholipid acyltransferase family protein [Amorphus orientalis]|uniref:KDO2-lipid IV(A) lauroyltransferase n=1 Tax=Amorphus orientalis TaxID=649198 RepID=A0AAE4ATA9_9HYPH|nr:lauroyl acyltransferase [Amorphus orientalis]MDQ0315930.1 KDO2-lipid IV(A) lauroyltransferase [Amorphus orientalis]